MKSRHISQTLVLALILTLIFLNPLFAKQLPADASPLKVLKKALHLTEEQTTALRGFMEIRATADAATKDLIKQNNKELEAILKSDAPDAPDATEIGEIVLETRVLRGEFGQHDTEFKSAFLDLLTPEQKKQMRHINQIALANQAAKALGKLDLR